MVSAMTACSARAGLRPGRSRLEAAQRTIKASRALRRVSTSATSLRLTILEPNPRQRLELAVNLVRTTPSLAASSHRSAASPRVARVGARSVPRRSATWESRRQALASATVAKVVRIGRRSRADQTWAWKMGVQVQESPSAKSSGGRGEPGRPRGGGGEGRSCRVLSHATIVEPDPAKGSSTESPEALEFRSAISTSSRGFIVGCSREALGRGISSTVVAALSPNQSAPKAVPGGEKETSHSHPPSRWPTREADSEDRLGEHGAEPTAYAPASAHGPGRAPPPPGPHQCQKD